VTKCEHLGQKSELDKNKKNPVVIETTGFLDGPSDRSRTCGLLNPIPVYRLLSVAMGCCLVLQKPFISNSFSLILTWIYQKPLCINTLRF